MNRFDLEQEIMNAWHVVDDLAIMAEYLEGDNKVKLLALTVSADMRFQRLMNVFESLVHDRLFKELNDEVHD